MLQLIKKFAKSEKGAIAVETAIVAPVVIMTLLPAIDLGMQIHTLQRMNKATDSGIEYVVNGGRDEVILRNIVQDSFGKTIQAQDLEITAYCGCIVSSSDNDDGDDEDGDGSDQYAGYYVKTVTNLTEDMCPATCDSGAEPSELVNLSLSRWVSGSLSSKEVKSKLQTRLK